MKYLIYNINMLYFIIVTICNVFITTQVDIWQNNYTQLSMDNYYLLVLYGFIVSSAIWYSYKQIKNDHLGDFNYLLSLTSFIIPFTKQNHLFNNLHLISAITSSILAIYLICKIGIVQYDFKFLSLNIFIIIIALSFSLWASQIIGISEFIISELIIGDLWYLKSRLT